jgi:hypothetical protein
VPIYRHTCRECGDVTTDLLGLESPNPTCCGSSMVRLMPRRVVGRVINPSAGPPARAPRPAPVQPDQLRRLRQLERPEGLDQICKTRPEALDLPPVDPSLPAIPWASSVAAKPVTERNAGERDAGWRDTCEAMTEWQAQWLERDGVDRGAALRKASTTQQAVVEQARAEVGG